MARSPSLACMKAILTTDTRHLQKHLLLAVCDSNRCSVEPASRSKEVTRDHLHTEFSFRSTLHNETSLLLVFYCLPVPYGIPNGNKDDSLNQQLRALAAALPRRLRRICRQLCWEFPVLRQRQLGVCCICDNRTTRRYVHAMLNRKIPVCKDSICLLA
jgi:hypothetical protein